MSDAAACPKCKGPSHPEFNCWRTVTWTDKRGRLMVRTFENEEQARIFCERENAK